MVESIKALNEICQKPDYKTKGNWYVRTILRDAALPMTWLLLHTKISADQVTLISLAVALVGMVALAMPGNGWFVAGVLLLQLWYYLDHVDGQIARYRKTDCLTGRFLDFMTHHIVHVSLLFAMGFYGFEVTGRIAFILWGFISAMAILVFNLSQDVKCKTFYEKIERQAVVVIQKRPVEAASRKTSLPKKTFSFLHKLCEIHVMMNLLTLLAVLQPWMGAADLRFCFLFFFGVLCPLIMVFKLSYILMRRKIDEDYRAFVDERAL